MALIKKNSPAAAPAADAPAAAAAPATAPKFESEPDVAGEGAVEQPVAAVVATPSTETAVVVQPASAVSITRPGKLVDVLGTLKDTLTVDYNTLARLQVNQGNYLIHETKVALGDVIDFELLSYQDQFVIAPGEDGDEAAKTVRYSKDGKVTDDGEDCMGYLNRLRDVYPDATMKPRCIIVINLTGSSKKGTEDYCDKLYQVDLASTSKAKFDTYRHQTSFDVSRGRKTAAEAVMVRSSVSTVTKGKLTWSVADFTYQPKD